MSLSRHSQESTQTTVPEDAADTNVEGKHTIRVWQLDVHALHIEGDPAAHHDESPLKEEKPYSIYTSWEKWFIVCTAAFAGIFR